MHTCHLGSRTKVSTVLQLASSELSMVAELLKRQLLVIILSFLLGIFVVSGSCSALILDLTMLGPKGLQPSVL